MSKVIRLCQPDSIAHILDEAATRALTEIVVIGRTADGQYWLRHSPCKDIFVQLGMAARLAHEINVTVDENN